MEEVDGETGDWDYGSVEWDRFDWQKHMKTFRAARRKGKDIGGSEFCLVKPKVPRAARGGARGGRGGRGARGARGARGGGRVYITLGPGENIEDFLSSGNESEDG